MRRTTVVVVLASAVVTVGASLVIAAVRPDPSPTPAPTVPRTSAPASSATSAPGRSRPDWYPPAPDGSVSFEERCWARGGVVEYYPDSPYLCTTQRGEPIFGEAGPR